MVQGILCHLGNQVVLGDPSLQSHLEYLSYLELLFLQWILVDPCLLVVLDCLVGLWLQGNLVLLIVQVFP